MTQRKLLIGGLALALALAGLFLVIRQSSAGADEPADFRPGKCDEKKYRQDHKKACQTVISVTISYDESAPNLTAPLPSIDLTVTGPNKYSAKATADSSGKAAFIVGKKAKFTVTAVAPTGYTFVLDNPQIVNSVVGEKTNVIFTILPPTGTDPTPTPTASSTPSGSSSPTANLELPMVFIQFPVQAPYPIQESPIEPSASDWLRLDKLTNQGGKQYNDFVKDLIGPFEGRQTFWNFALAHSFYSNRSIKPGINGYPLGIHLFGVKDAKNIDNNYIISHGISTSEKGLTDWTQIRFHYKGKSKKQLQVYYRVSDTITKDKKSSDWVAIPIKYHKNDRVLNFPINKTGRYFQYKIHISSQDSLAFVDNLAIVGQPIGDNLASPTPTGSLLTPTPTTSLNSPSPGLETPSGEGEITIKTVKLLASNSRTKATSSSGPVLPIIESPSPSAAPSLDPNDLCFGSNSQTEPIADVSLKIRQTAGGGFISPDDQITDSDGLWQGIDGEIDTFGIGTYEATFGEFDKQNYKLVAFCDPDKDSPHLLRSLSDPNTSRAVFQVKNGETSKLTALYALRNNPYISMNKFAVPANLKSGDKAKVLRVAYLGQQFMYLIRYTNTGGAKATNLIIHDVIPAELEVDQALLEEDNIDITPDVRGGNLVKATVGELAAGQSGSIRIPVKLRVEAFTESGELNVLAP